MSSDRAMIVKVKMSNVKWWSYDCKGQCRCLMSSGRAMIVKVNVDV